MPGMDAGDVNRKPVLKKIIVQRKGQTDTQHCAVTAGRLYRWWLATQTGGVGAETKPSMHYNNLFFLLISTLATPSSPFSNTDRTFPFPESLSIVHHVTNVFIQTSPIVLAITGIKRKRQEKLAPATMTIFKISSSFKCILF